MLGLATSTSLAIESLAAFDVAAYAPGKTSFSLGAPASLTLS
jgi:hypothetical protein